MSIVKWTVSPWSKPERQEYSHETEHFYMHARGRGRTQKINIYLAFFDSEAEALEYIRQREENKAEQKRVDQIKRYGVELLASLEAVVSVADRETDVFITARAIIAKAKGEAQ